MSKSYQDLEIFKLSLSLFIRAHQLSRKLPHYELFELGSQLRRSSDSINSNIVEGNGRRNYKNEFIRFLIFAHASNDETINHLKKINLLYPDFASDITPLLEEYDMLGRKLHKFIDYVRKNWKS